MDAAKPVAGLDVTPERRALGYGPDLVWWATDGLRVTGWMRWYNDPVRGPKVTVTGTVRATGDGHEMCLRDVDPPDHEGFRVVARDGTPTDSLLDIEIVGRG